MASTPRPSFPVLPRRTGRADAAEPRRLPPPRRRTTLTPSPPSSKSSTGSHCPSPASSHPSRSHSLPSSFSPSPPSAAFPEPFAAAVRSLTSWSSRYGQSPPSWLFLAATYTPGTPFHFPLATTYIHGAAVENIFVVMLPHRRTHNGVTYMILRSTTFLSCCFRAGRFPNGGQVGFDKTIGTRHFQLHHETHSQFAPAGRLGGSAGALDPLCTMVVEFESWWGFPHGAPRNLTRK